MIDESAWLAAWEGPDTEALVALTDPQVEVLAVTLGTETRTYNGHDGMRQWMRDIDERFQARTTTASLTPLADDVVLIGGMLVVDDGFGGEEEQPFGIVVHLRDDRALWMGTFFSTADAKAAFDAGLTGPS
jgi:ketosteroid isomerase-like protein